MPGEANLIALRSSGHGDLTGAHPPSPLTARASALAGGMLGPAELRPLLVTVLDALTRGAADRDGPVPDADPRSLAAATRKAADHEFLPEIGVGAHAALGELTQMFAAGAADPADPRCAAHLHCPPLAVAVAADLAAAVLNPSMDSWDQAPSGTALEPEVVAAVAELVGYPPAAGGTVTSGGTESNLMGLLLARDFISRVSRGHEASRQGLAPEDAGRLRVLCSTAAHFSVARSAGLLGFGEDAVIAVHTNVDHTMDATALQRELTALHARGETAVAILATAGTTDLGAIDPLVEIADVAAEFRTWLHVDAAYGGGALFSRRLAPLLAGLQRADSVTLDLHKFGWQPVPAGIFLTRSADLFAPLERSVAYLNAWDDEQAGYPSLLNRSLRTTRRPDVFKIAVTLRALGRTGLEGLIDRCHDLARYGAAQVAAHPRLELFADPVLSTVMFRYRPSTGRDQNQINAELRRALLAEGQAVIGRTEVDGAVWLKLTLLNPHATERDVAALLEAVVTAGDRETEEARMTAPPAVLADSAGTQALLRCWVRETDLAAPSDGVLRLDLCASGTSVQAAVEYWSAVGWHRFGPATFPGGAPVDAVTLAALLSAESALRRDCGRHQPPAAAAVVAAADLTGRVSDSVRRVARHIAERRAKAEEPPSATPFLTAEQALLLGHPLHPTPKSREGLSETEAAAYSPELRGSFAMHWFAADPSVVSADSALQASAAELTYSLSGEQVQLPPGTVAVPAHPWQAREVRARPGVQELLDQGLLHDLGPAGPAWFPTSSVRTVYRADAPVMLKLSLGLCITNSKRENLRLELRRGVEVCRLLNAGLGAVLRAAHPGFAVVQDPAWIAVDAPGERPESGLEVVIRDNPFGADPVACVAGLVAERPDLPHGRSQLAMLVQELATRTGRPLTQVAEEWFARYLEAVVRPVLWLYAEHGLGLEAHQQNTLVVLDRDGWPVGGRYRDNQGYYFSATRSGGLSRWLPGAGQELGTWCADEVIDERLGYYIGINNLLGLVGAMGSQALADEHVLLVQVRKLLTGLVRAHGETLRVASTLLEAPTLRCKANLFTRVDGLDELVGSLETQSVYVDVTNPVREVRG